MFGKNAVSDRDLLKTVKQKLMRAGSQSQVTASVRQGIVTLAGNLRYETQRSPLVKAARSTAGVKSVVDQLRVPPKPKALPG